MLTLIRTVHTIVWVFFVGCILDIFIYAHAEKIGIALILIGIIVGEGVILAVNRWRCPLTNISARYTDNRADNFDIYLPLWIAKHNKGLFGSLFIFGIGYTVYIGMRGWLSAA